LIILDLFKGTVNTWGQCQIKELYVNKELEMMKEETTKAYYEVLPGTWLELPRISTKNYRSAIHVTEPWFMQRRKKVTEVRET
jgi:uncharacterized phage-associated protein